MDNHENANTFSYVEDTGDIHSIGSTMVTKVKRNEHGEVVELKSRLCARGDQQEFGIDYDEITAQVVKMTSLRLMLAIATDKQWVSEQMDVVAAYLNAVMKKVIHMRQPHGHQQKMGQNGKPMLLRLNKTIYGLKQAGREWMMPLTTFLVEQLNFKQTINEPCIFTKEDIIIAVYVDDVVISGGTQQIVDEFKSQISAQYKMKALGSLKYILGIKVDTGLTGDYHLTQGAYIRQTITRFNMDGEKMAHTPEITGNVLMKATTKYDGNFPYREVI